MNPIVLVVMALATLITAVVAVTSAISKSAEKQREKNDADIESANAIQEEVDANNELYLFIDEVPPKKEREKWIGRTYSTIIDIPKHHFTEVQWSDKEPTKVKLVIDK